MDNVIDAAGRIGEYKGDELVFKNYAMINDFCSRLKKKVKKKKKVELLKKQEGD